MPSAAGLVVIVKLIAFVTFAYHIRVQRMPTLSGIVAFILFMIGALGFYEGFVLAVREDSRVRYGQVVSGVVMEKYQAAGRYTSSSTGRRGPHSGGSGFLMTRAFAHRMAHGTFAIRMVDYRYPCDAGRGTCHGRDYVGPELWNRVQVGAPINVRQAKGETTTARLDENSQRTLALAQIAFSAVFLAAAAWLTGRLKLSLPKRQYLTAPALVMAVEEVAYRDETRWKVRFAYFDQQGRAQESADEVSQSTWNRGDDCVAVYRPEAPDLATLQPTHSRRPDGPDHSSRVGAVGAARERAVRIRPADTLRAE
jgi:hypothetical protein